MIEVADVDFCCAKSIGLVADNLGLVIEALNRSVMDGHREVVHQIILVAAQHPGEIPHGR